MLDKLIRTVKGQLSYFDNQVRVWSRNPDRPGFEPHKLAKYKQLAYEFQDVLDYLLQQRRIERTMPLFAAAADEDSSDTGHDANQSEPEEIVPTQKATPEFQTQVSERAPLNSRGDDLSDLPPELLKELSDSFKGETDPLITIINDRGGTASIDEILVDLYRKFGEIGKRPIISNKLYRFSRRGLCAAVPGKKGIYTTDSTFLQAGEEEEEEEEGPDTGMYEPSSKTVGVAGSPERPSNPAPVGSSPTTSTFKARRELFASTAIPSVRIPK